MFTDDTQRGQYGGANLLIGWGVTESYYTYTENTAMSAMAAATKKTVIQFLNIDLGFRILITTFYFCVDLRSFVCACGLSLGFA